MALSGVLAAMLPFGVALALAVLLVGLVRRRFAVPLAQARADLLELRDAGILSREQVALAWGELERAATLAKG